MRRIISIIAALCMLLSLVTVVPVAAAVTTLLDDFEGYSAYTEHSDFLAALTAKYPDSAEKSGSRIEVIYGKDKLGEESGMLHMQSTGSRIDPYIQGIMDMDGIKLVSFDVKIDSISQRLRVCYRDGNTAPVGWYDLLDKGYDTDVTTVFGTRLDWTPVKDKWHHVAVVTSFDGENTLSYSAYIDGEKIQPQTTYSNTVAKYKNVGVRFGITSPQSGGTHNGYFDNIRIIPGEDVSFDDMTTLPLNNDSAVSPDQSAAIFRFGTEINPSTLDISDIQVTRSVGGSETDILPVEVLFTGDALKLLLSDGQLELGADYAITLPGGVEDVLGNPLPENKRTLRFSTVTNPNNQQPVVSLVRPSGNVRIDPGDSVTLEAEATDPDGSITNVVFFADGQEIGRTNQAPYTFTWDNIPAGSHTVFCQAYDNDGGRSTSNEVTIRAEINQHPNAVLIAPVDGSEVAVRQAVTLTAEAEDPNGETPVKVEFYVDYEKIGEAYQEPFTCSWTPEEEGDYTLTARAYDLAGAGPYSAPVTVSAAQQYEIALFEWDADDFDGAANTVKSGGTLVANGTGTFSGVTVDEEHGISMKCEMTGPITQNTPYFNITIPEQSSGILIAEADLMVDNPSLQVQCWTVRSNDGFDTELLFDGGTVKVQNPNASPMTYKSKSWYTVKNVYNFDYVNNAGAAEPHVDIYINDVLIASKHFQNTNVTSIPQMRFTLLAPEEGTGAMYLDNFKISKIVSAPKLGALVAREASGAVLGETELEAARIDTLVISSSNTLTARTITGESVKLYKGYGDMEIPAAISYEADIQSIVVKPETNLEAGAVYRVVLDSTISDTNGISIGRDRSSSIRTMVGECGVQNGSFRVNGAVLNNVMSLTSGDVVIFRGEGVNRDGSTRQIWIITALYKDAGMENYTLKSVELSPGTENVETELNIERDVTPAHSLRCFVWDGETGVALGEQFMLK